MKMYRFLSAFILLLLLSPASHSFQQQSQQIQHDQDLQDVQVLYVENGGKWGEWGDTAWCPDGTYAAGFSLMVEGEVVLDNTALNGISLYCTDSSGKFVNYTKSKLGSWGEWTKYQWCPSGPLKSFQLNTQPPQGIRDDTAANNIRFKCDDKILEGEGLSFGKWGDWSEECENGICGIQTKQEKYQGLGDDTGLNDVIFFCCKDSAKTKKVQSAH